MQGFGKSKTASIAPHPASAIQSTAFLQVRGSGLIAAIADSAHTITVAIMRVIL